MAKEHRKPTYGAATRLARIMVELPAHPFGWSFEAIQRRLNISDRTLLRYVSVCRQELVDHRGRPILEVLHQGERRLLRFADSMQRTDSSAFQAASLFFTLTLLRFLEGTVLKEGVENLWDRIQKSLTNVQSARLRDLNKKLYAVPYLPKDYKAFDEQLDVIFRALIDQQRLRIDYVALGSEPKTHNFDPYTLVAYRGGLYLLGRSDLAREFPYLAIERIQTVDFLRNDDGEPLKFALPRDYDPAKYTEGSFGIVTGDEADIELLILNAETETYLRSREIHPTQRFRRRRDGKTVLNMTVRGTTELRNWILSLGPWVEVLKPPLLRSEISGLIGETARLYRSRR
jgi:proteasome accessory factor B